MKGLLCVLLLIMAAPAAATQYNWPALYDVTGVAADDVLNLREAPNAASEIIGTLAHDSTNIEVVKTNDTETWGLVNIDERSGWVSLNFMQRRPDQWAGNPPEIAQCFGTEPFWSFSVNQGAGQWSTPEGTANFALSPGVVSQNRIDRFAFNGVKFDPTSEILVEEQVSVFVSTAQCSDGMSDRSFGLTADLFFNGDSAPSQTHLLSGCCTLTP